MQPKSTRMDINIRNVERKLLKGCDEYNRVPVNAAQLLRVLCRRYSAYIKPPNQEDEKCKAKSIYLPRYVDCGPFARKYTMRIYSLGLVITTSDQSMEHDHIVV